MLSYIFNSRITPILGFCLVLMCLIFAWETTIRANYNPQLNVKYGADLQADTVGNETLDSKIDSDRQWLIFGNCLMLNSLSPKIMLTEWNRTHPDRNIPKLANLSNHEQAPQSYLTYLENIRFYPKVVIVNVSPWIFSNNYEYEAQQLEKENLLGSAGKKEEQKAESFGLGLESQEKENTFQKRSEAFLVQKSRDLFKFTVKRYHLFDFGYFVTSLLTSWDLKASLYQLNIQSWFQMMGAVEDGLGYTGVKIRYNPDWEQGTGIMIKKQLARMELGYFLTPNYWSSLEKQIKRFSKKGTQIILLRMPENPTIYQFIEARYDLNKNLHQTIQNTEAIAIDLNRPDVLNKVKLFDGVHPDAKSSTFISKWLAKEISQRWSNLVYSDTGSGQGL